MAYMHHVSAENSKSLTLIVAIIDIIRNSMQEALVQAKTKDKQRNSVTPRLKHRHKLKHKHKT